MGQNEPSDRKLVGSEITIHWAPSSPFTDIDGGNRKRLTNNAHYDAEVSVSPDGMKIVFSRQFYGAMDLYMMNSDGTGETKLTDTLDWQEGAPFYLPDSKLEPRHLWHETSDPHDDLYDKCRDRRAHPAHPRRLDELGALSGAGWTARQTGRFSIWRAASQ